MTRPKALVLAPGTGLSDVRVRNAAMALEAAGAEVTIAIPGDESESTFSRVAGVSLEWFDAPPALLAGGTPDLPRPEQTSAGAMVDPRVQDAERQLREWDRDVEAARQRLRAGGAQRGRIHPLRRLRLFRADTRSGGRASKAAPDTAALKGDPGVAALRDYDRAVETARLRLELQELGSGHGVGRRIRRRRLQARLDELAGAGRDGAGTPRGDRDTNAPDQPARAGRPRSSARGSRRPRWHGGGRSARRTQKMEAWKIEIGVGRLLEGQGVDLIYVMAPRALPAVIQACENARTGLRAPDVACDWQDASALRRVKPGPARELVATASSPWLSETLGRTLRLSAAPATVLNAPLDVPWQELREPHTIVKAARSLQDPLVVIPWYEGVEQAAGTLYHLVESTPYRFAVLAPPAQMPAARRTVEAFARGLADPGLRPVQAPDADRLPSVLRDTAVWVEASVVTGARDTTLPSGLLAAAAARVPLLVSATAPAQAEFCRSLGTGEIVPPANPGAIIAALEKIVRDRARYTMRYEQLDASAVECSAQIHALGTVTRRLRGKTDERVPQAGRSLALGPRNINGNLWGWAASIRKLSSDLRTEVFEVEFAGSDRLRLEGPGRAIPLSDWQDPAWAALWTRHLIFGSSHVLIEQGLTACGWLHGKSFHDDLPTLTRNGVTVGLIFNGSDARNPGGHASREPFSPFADPAEPTTERLQKRADRMGPLIASFEGAKFVTTPDLLDDVPGARWLPQVIDFERWSPGRPALESKVPVVLHAPSSEKMKGSAWVDAACRPLDAAGVIEYRRITGAHPDQMPDIIRNADIVVDQMALGSYGVLALQAMAAGRVVVGHVAPHVRARVPGGVPVVEAVPDILGTTLAALVAQPERFREARDRGPEYVKRFHDGTVSAGRLAEFVGIGVPESAQALLDELDALGDASLVSTGG